MIFIVLEGIEGSGKSTQVRMLAEWLAGAGVPHLVAREPGGTAAGEEIRRLLLHADDVPARAELLLMLSARAFMVEQVVRPALEAGTVVLMDRFELSTLAYQGYGRGLLLEQVKQLNAFATGGLRPDITIVLDVPLEQGERRRTEAGRSPDRIEKAGNEFHTRVAEAYGLLASSEPGVTRVDGTGAPGEVHARIQQTLRGLFPETFPARTG